ncbi:MAG TPA: MarR family transcriptional regulator [Candidatus Binatia bacterium]|nr:MarR family transcriptional regulator [Candidatus Binatia bacterium]
MRALSTPSLAAGLSSTLSRLRRSLNRRVRAAIGVPPLPEAQLEVLRLVQRRPATSIHDAARELGVASNTVSTLVHRLTEAGLIEREADPADGRVARLSLTPAAARRLETWRNRRHEILTGLLRSFGEDDLESLATALPVLERLVTLLESEPDGGDGRVLPAWEAPDGA